MVEPINVPSPKPSGSPRGGDLFHSAFGKVTGGTVKLGADGTDHISVYGDGGHFSWDVKGGEVTADKKGLVGPHGTDHGGGHF